MHLYMYMYVSTAAAAAQNEYKRKIEEHKWTRKSVLRIVVYSAGGKQLGKVFSKFFEVFNKLFNKLLLYNIIIITKYELY